MKIIDEVFETHPDDVLVVIEALDKITHPVATATVGIYRDIRSRRGLRQEFDEIDSRLQVEIVEEWARIITVAFTDISTPG